VRQSNYQQGLPGIKSLELGKQSSTMFRVLSALSGKQQDVKTVTITQSDLGDLDEEVAAERLPTDMMHKKNTARIHAGI
jgi:hypothetical protein